MTDPTPTGAHEHDRRRAEYEAQRREYLAKMQCPDSGGTLFYRPDGADGALPGTFACDMCDCFGYRLIPALGDG